jgi:ribosomal protein S12 methylthiotransferase accessory factor
MDRHPVTRRPQCPACGDATRFTRQAGEPIVLQRRASDLNWSSRDRIQPPDETMRQHQSVLDPLTGVVGNLRRCGSPDDDLLHVYAAAFHGAVHSSTSTLARSLQAGSGGKGMTDAHARASAVGESIEHYSGAFQGDEPQALAALDELGDAGIHPNRCMLISEYQYHCQEEHNRRPSDRNSIPARFDPSARISWTPIWSLTHQSHRYLPTKYLYFGCPSVEEDGIAAPDSNGNAAGNTIEEAILHGLLELVERDSVALWWYNRVQRPQVELAAMELEYVARLLNRYRSLGRELWVLDLTSDLGIPVFGAVSRRPDRTSEEILLGFGAHLDPGLAVIRALTEVNQLLVSVTTSKTTGAPLGPEFERWLACGSVSEHEYLLPGGYGPPLLQAEGAMPGDLLEAIGLCQTRIEDRGMEVLVLDQTRPDLMFPSVKVVVPGLRSFRPRFAPGRLYDGPVAAGWISTAVTESGLNQLPFFL